MNTTRLDKLSFFYLHMKFHAKAWKGSEGNRNAFWNSWWFKEGNYFYFVVNTLVRHNLSARSAKGRCRAPVLQSRKSNLQSSEKLLGFLKFTCVSSVTALCLFLNQFVHNFVLEYHQRTGKQLKRMCGKVKELYRGHPGGGANAKISDLKNMWAEARIPIRATTSTTQHLQKCLRVDVSGCVGNLGSF